MDTTKKVLYDRNLPYNTLPLLPLPDNVIDKEVLLKWGLAGRALAELNKNMLRLPNPSMLVNTISLREAKTSSEIENIFTTEDELYMAISDSVKESEANPATKEVLRYREALWAGYNRIMKSGKIDLATVISIYQKVKDTREKIRSPQSLTVIKRGMSQLRPGEIVYTPPRGKGVVEAKMKNMLDYLNNDEFDTDPLLKMAIAHYQFEAIHPFSDGNGRTGRIINLLYLVNQGLLSHPVLYLSKYIIENKEDYYHNLQRVTRQQAGTNINAVGAWKNWILYMMKAVEQTAKHSNRMIDDIANQMQATLTYTSKKLPWYSKELNEALFAQPYIKPKLIGRIAGRTSRTTLGKYMHELTKLQVLSVQQSGKEVYYINNDLLRILNSE
jgi:Fic family protein